MGDVDNTICQHDVFFTPVQIDVDIKINCTSPTSEGDAIYGSAVRRFALRFNHRLRSILIDDREDRTYVL